jgi:hypothetical protein
MGKNQQKPISTKININKCKWIEHTIRKPPSDITKAALEWKPQGTRNRGRLRTIWGRSVLNELKSEKKSWSELKALAAKRTRWRNFTRALCCTDE